MNHERQGRGGISVQTLVIASAASASASFAIARIWGPGTLLGAAAAPVIVALVSEVLRRPLQHVSASGKHLPAAPTTPAEAEHASLPPGMWDGPASKWRRRWWMALGTGLMAFAIVVGAYTIPDLLTGHSITDNGQPTTFFGGTRKATSKPSPTRAVTKTTTATVRTTRAASTPRTTSTATATTQSVTSTVPTTTPTVSTLPATASTPTTTPVGTPPVTTSSPQTTPTTTPAP